ncbi:MAG: PSD1 and planctomycete cytochrome C domain-containing protein [Planctomycetaceae bacterium]
MDHDVVKLFNFRRLCLLASVLFSGSTLTADESVPGPGTPAGVEYFEKQVRPILVQYCYECHAGDEREGGLSLDSRAGVLNGGDTGPAVVIEDVDSSLLLQAIRYKNRDLQMPPENRLSDQEIGVLEKWIAMGLPDPRQESTTAAAPTGMSIEEGLRFWSLQPVSNFPLPEVQKSAWGKNSIDAFILAGLEAQGILPAPPADKRSLIRRVTLNLTGLPPTVDEMDAFLSDESDAAYENLVERLLASPQYGVHWGRHWLDVARYADSNGLDENLAYGHAWRYRDYVIDAFNNDKPFDRFLIEQLAGDLVPESSQETQTATGFLALGAKVLAEPDMEKLVMDTIDEQLDTTGKAFMGMTLGCVRCHDHKFDPLLQTDYYALAAIFKSTRTFSDTRTGIIKHWYEHSFATDAEKEELKAVDQEIAKKKSAASSFKSAAMAEIRKEARSKAADYLAACVGISPDDPFSEFEVVAKTRDLHPGILHHCRIHLEYHRYDTLFADWHNLMPFGAPFIEKYYQQIFAAADEEWSAATKADPQTKVLDDPQLEAARLALNDASGFLAIPPKVDYAFDAETLQEYYRLEEEARVIESQAKDAAAAMGVGEQETLSSLPIHIRGSHRNLGDEVVREFPEVMRTSRVRPVFPTAQGGRLELARWLGSTQHPLTARVFVNRVWNWHFGRGIVASTENFGRLGSRPTHPQLLDWLAHRFMASGWKIKDLHRLILSSSTYQMAVTHPDESMGQAADPENKLLWKFRLQRLTAEQLRDSLLAVAGRLDTTLGGKTVPLRNQQFVFNHTSQDHTKYNSVRRSVYVPVIRNNLYTLFEQFDFPDPTMPTGRRNETVIAPQALLLMNSELVVASAQQMASHLMNDAEDDSQRVSLAYRTAVGRPPTSAETNRALAFIDDLSAARVTATGLDEEKRIRVWAMFCQSLIASNEFMYLR